MQTKNSQSSIISVSHLSKKFDQQEIFKDISFTLSKGEKIGLVGQNGSGKSTLLKIIVGLITNDEGSLYYQKNLKTEYLPQVHLENTNLSGGEIAKKILAPIIASDAELFLLDEPTNNLDKEGLIMVEDFISTSNKTFLIISHDRMFLDKTVDKIFEIDTEIKSFFVYPGNYSAYREARDARIHRQWKEYTDKTEKVGKFNSSMDQRLTWMKKIEKTRKNIKNLPMHEREKPVAAILRDKEAKAGRRARIMKDRLEKYKKDSNDILKPAELPPLKIEFEHERGSTKVFDIENLEKKIGSTKIGPLTVSINYGDRIHIAGANGAGKTTLLKMLLGESEADRGMIEKGENVKIGYIPQERWINTLDKTVLEEFMDATKLEQTHARKILSRFRINSEDVSKHISTLSPGEYSRFVIAELVAKNPNCIILDEPSNHLDLEVLQEFEEALRKYTGTLVIVSHDRYFVERVYLIKELNISQYSTKKS